jgi:hypothetical protein
MGSFRGTQGGGEAAFGVEVVVPLLQPASVPVEVQAWPDYGCARICSPNLQQLAAMVAQPVDALPWDNPPRHNYQSSASWPSNFCTTDNHPLRRCSCGRRQPPWPPAAAWCYRLLAGESVALVSWCPSMGSGEGDWSGARCMEEEGVGHPDLLGRRRAWPG